MSSEVKISAIAFAEMEAKTAEDLRALVDWLNKYEIPNNADIDWSHGKVYVELTGNTSVPAEWIECGDHVPPKIAFDVLVPMHEHPEYKQYPENYEEALEQALDRYGDKTRPE